MFLNLRNRSTPGERLKGECILDCFYSDHSGDFECGDCVLLQTPCEERNARSTAP